LSGEAMKIIGILGGMSPASTQIYYRQLCQLAQERLGGHGAAAEP